MRQRPRPLDKKLDPSTYNHDSLVTLRVAFAGADAGRVEQEVQVPLPLMYRLYHLGRAYDLPKVAALHPSGMFYVDFISMQVLRAELELLASIISDAALKPHLEAIGQLLEQTSEHPNARMLVKPA